MNFFRYLSPSRVPNKGSAKSMLHLQRETLLQYVLNLFLAGCVLILPLAAVMRGNPAYQSMLQVLALTIIGVAVLALARNIHFYIRSGIVTAIFYLVGMAFLLRNGLNGGGVLLLFLAALLSSFMFNLWVAGIIFMLCTVSIIISGDLMSRSVIVLPDVLAQATSVSFDKWAMTAGIFALSGLVTLIANFTISRGLTHALQSQQKLVDALGQERADLEKRVEERSSIIRKRLSQFEVASQIARDISLEVNLNSLLDSAVKMIRDRFEYDHAGIFLTDEHDEYAVLSAATGEAGRQMLANEHHLQIGTDSMVGFVIKQGEPRVAGDVTSDSTHYKNPFLPDTRSEIALPLKVGRRVIGALDVQSVTENAFTQEDMRILQTVTDQLANAVDKARIMQQLQDNLNELEINQQQTTRQAWEAHLRNARKKFAYRFKNSQFEGEVSETPQALEAAARGKPVVQIIQSDQGDSTTLAVPIKLRNHVLGVVDLHFESSQVSPDLIAIIESTVDRLAVSLDNARLLEEIQLSAERDRLVSDITSKVRSSAEVDNILRIAAQEIGKSLGASEVIVQLRPYGA